MKTEKSKKDILIETLVSQTHFCCTRCKAFFKLEDKCFFFVDEATDHDLYCASCYTYLYLNNLRKKFNEEEGEFRILYTESNSI